MKPISIVGMIVASLGTIAAISLYARKKIRFLGLVFWVLIWLFLGMISVFPSIVYSLAGLFSMVYGPYFIFAASVMGLYVIAFLLYNALKRVEGQVYHLAQSIALLRHAVERSEVNAEDGSRNDCRSE